MNEDLIFHFDVDGSDFTSAGQASVQLKKNLRQLGISPDIIRRVSIAMYEGEINMAMPTPPPTPRRLASWVQKASACAVPSICSLRLTVSLHSAR